MPSWESFPASPSFCQKCITKFCLARCYSMKLLRLNPHPFLFRTTTAQTFRHETSSKLPKIVYEIILISQLNFSFLLWKSFKRRMRWSVLDKRVYAPLTPSHEKKTQHIISLFIWIESFCAKIYCSNLDSWGSEWSGRYAGNIWKICLCSREWGNFTSEIRCCFHTPRHLAPPSCPQLHDPIKNWPKTLNIGVFSWNFDNFSIYLWRQGVDTPDLTSRHEGPNVGVIYLEDLNFTYDPLPSPI